MKRFYKDLNLFINHAEPKIEKILDETALQVLKDAKLKTPVKTGVLRSNWKVSSDYLERTIHNNTHYAQYVEKGHRTRNGKDFVQGHFMLEKAMRGVEEELDRQFGKILEDLFG